MLTIKMNVLRYRLLEEHSVVFTTECTIVNVLLYNYITIVRVIIEEAVLLYSVFVVHFSKPNILLVTLPLLYHVWYSYKDFDEWTERESE